jgi:hypothetical protein
MKGDTVKKVTYYGLNPASFEGFPEGCERSCDGALFFSPNQQKLITDGEYEHVTSAAYKHEAGNFEVHADAKGEKVLLGKRKGAANSINLRDPKKVQQYDGNQLHVDAKSAKDLAESKEGSGSQSSDKSVEEKVKLKKKDS